MNAILIKFIWLSIDFFSSRSTQAASTSGEK